MFKTNPSSSRSITGRYRTEIISTLGETVPTSHHWPLGDEGKQAMLQGGVAGPPPYPERAGRGLHDVPQLQKAARAECTCAPTRIGTILSISNARVSSILTPSRSATRRSASKCTTGSQKTGAAPGKWRDTRVYFDTFFFHKSAVKGQ